MSKCLNTLECSRLFEAIQADLKNLSWETKKKFPLIKESTEEAIVKIRSIDTSKSLEAVTLYRITNQILYPLIQGCETKDGKTVRLCLNLIQRLIIHKVVDFKGGRHITDSLWMLMESNVEEVKILQTLTLLLTSTHVIQNETLAKCLVICFRLNFSKDTALSTIAGATVRQLIPVVFERVVASSDNELCQLCLCHYLEEPNSSYRKLMQVSNLPHQTQPFITDAYLMFQDIVLLVNGEQPLWLNGIIEMTRTFGLELLESLLTKFPVIFVSYSEFKFILKEKVCSLVIKLFSPSIKYKQASNMQDKPMYQLTSKLVRVVAILILEYHDILTTETEIFLSLITKFLDPDKPVWQNCIALEVVHKILVLPEIMLFICKEFDSKDHSTKVFQDIINCLGAYVQNVMSSNPLNNSEVDSSGSGQSTHQINQMSLSHQPGFYYRNVWKPLTMNFVGGQTKEFYLEMSDKCEPPLMSDGYGVSLAYVCLLDVIRSLSILINGPENGYSEQLIESSWCGILTPLSLLLDASTDDGCTENILKHFEIYVSLCGKLRKDIARDAYLASMCKASLPPHYTLTVLKSTPSTQTVSGPPKELSSSAAAVDSDLRHQVVAVGTPLPTSSLPLSAHQGPVMLTSKNLQCMKAILSLAHCHGDLLGSSWHIILTSLQHLVWILGLKPVAGGALSSIAASENNSVITTAVMADLPVLTNMVTRLFESSSDLEDTSIQHLIEALCVLSDESMELATANREPSLFAVAKLLETGLVNLKRIDVVWRPITNHLLRVCQHPHLRMRQWGSEALTFLTKQALQSTSLNNLQTLLLSPLAELCAIPYPDVRQKQLDTVLHILHSSGEKLNHGWPITLTMIGSLENDHSDILIRSAFQCIQLVFTDFLPTMPYRCYPICVEMASKFGSQTAELNVSLTAIGLLWNLSDYFYQDVNSIQEDSACSVNNGNNDYIFPDFPGCKNMPSFDKLWMCLYCKLKDLCLDSRSSVRKSAGQTLFSTIAAHGSVLKSNTWQAVFWQVLFPLLDNVIIQSDNASSECINQCQSIMIHHSRNTARKQWSETKVLTISGVVRVFNTKRKILRTMGDYSKAWILLLEYVEKMALSETNEVSLAALKSFQEMITSSLADEKQQKLKEINWILCWKAWQNIGKQKTNYILNTSDTSLHSQILLTGFIQIFHYLFPYIEENFKRSDIEIFGEILLKCIEIPIDGESEYLTPVQNSVIEAFHLVKDAALKREEDVPEIYDILIKFANFALTKRFKNCRFGEKLSLFGENCLKIIMTLYDVSCSFDSVVDENILFRIIRVLAVPLKVKYGCPKQSNWKIGINVLMNVLRKGIPLARQGKLRNKFLSFWPELADLLEAFLFPECADGEDRIGDEAVDCHLVELLREEVLPYPSSIPSDFIRKIVILLNKGSIHSTMKLSSDCSGSVGLREDFAQQCFETLLDFSLLQCGETLNLQSDSSLTNKLAITSLLQRFKEVLQEAIDGEKLNRNIPLQRQKIAEISFVLKAIATVIASVKKSSKVDKKTWDQIIGLYPYLVQFTETTSPSIGNSVKEALMEYADLLRPADQ